MVQNFILEAEILIAWDTSYENSENRTLSCTANGVRTYLNGARENYSEKHFCSRTVKGKEVDPADWYWWMNPGPDTYVCRAARKFGKY